MLSSEGLFLFWEVFDEEEEGGMILDADGDSFCLLAGLRSEAGEEALGLVFSLSFGLAFGLALAFAALTAADWPEAAAPELRGFLVPRAVVAWWCFGAGGGVIVPVET